MAKNTAIIIFKDRVKGISVDLEIPLDITANEFVIAVNSAYQLGIDITDAKQCYLKAENPIALIRGNRLLSDFGIHTGTIVYNR